MSKQPNSLSKPRFSLSQTRSSKSKSSKSNKLSFSLSLKRLRLPHYRLRSSFVGQSLSRKLHRFSSRPISSALKHPYLNQMSLSNKEKLISIKKDKRLIKERLICQEDVFPFGDYFSDENFKIMLDKVLIYN